MKKILKIIIVVIISLSVSYMLYSIISKTNEIDAQKEKLKRMPKFLFTTLSGNTFSYSDIEVSKHTLIIYFSTTCIYCEKQIENITEEYNLLQNTQIVLVATEEKKSIIDFLNKFNVKKYEPNISVVISDTEYFIETFGLWNAPSIFLYNPDKQLLFLNEGVLGVDSIISHY